MNYKSWNAIKGQALADFLLEFEDGDQEWAIVPHEPARDVVRGLLVEDDTWWNLHVDGVVTSDGAGVGVFLVSLKRRGSWLIYELRSEVQGGQPGESSQRRIKGMML